MKTFDLRVKQLLDGDLSLADLPPELRAEGEEALRLLAAVDRTPVTLSPALDARVMALVRQHAKSPARPNSPAPRRHRCPASRRAAARAIRSSCGSCCTHPAHDASRWRAPSISGTAAPRYSRRPVRAVCGRPPSHFPSGSISTPLSWMAHAGWWIRAPQPWTTASVAATASSP